MNLTHRIVDPRKLDEARDTVDDEVAKLHLITERSTRTVYEELIFNMGYVPTWARNEMGMWVGVMARVDELGIESLDFAAPVRSSGASFDEHMEAMKAMAEGLSRGHEWMTALMRLTEPDTLKSSCICVTSDEFDCICAMACLTVDPKLAMFYSPRDLSRHVSRNALHSIENVETIPLGLNLGFRGGPLAVAAIKESASLISLLLAFLRVVKPEHNEIMKRDIAAMLQTWDIEDKLKKTMDEANQGIKGWDHIKLETARGGDRIALTLQFFLRMLNESIQELRKAVAS